MLPNVRYLEYALPFAIFSIVLYWIAGASFFWNHLGFSAYLFVFFLFLPFGIAARFLYCGTFPILSLGIYQWLAASGLEAKQFGSWIALDGSLTVFGAAYFYAVYLAVSLFVLLLHLVTLWAKTK